MSLMPRRRPRPLSCSAVGTAQASTIWADRPRPKTIIAPRKALHPTNSAPLASSRHGYRDPLLAPGVLLEPLPALPVPTWVHRAEDARGTTQRRADPRASISRPLGLCPRRSRLSFATVQTTHAEHLHPQPQGQRASVQGATRCGPGFCVGSTFRSGETAQAPLNLLEVSLSETSAVRSPKPISLHEFRKRRKPLRNVNREASQNLSAMDRLACRITDRVGTMGFFLIVLAWTVLWLGWNLLAPADLQFDPPMGFVFWLFISNLIQLLLMPLIMVGQNVQGRHSEMRAEHDLEVNIKAEEEIEVILQHLEYQNSLLIAMVETLGVKLDHNLGEKALRPKD